MPGLAHMKNIYPDCWESRTDKTFPLRDVKSRSRNEIIFSNPTKSENIIFQLDDCVVKDSTTRRCDFLLYDCYETEHFIELKGKDIAHGIKQLKTSMRQFGDKKKRKYCFIISSKVNFPRTIINNYTVNFYNEFNAILKIKNVKMTYPLPSPTQ